MSTPALCDKCGVEVMTPDAFDALRQRAEYAESRLASISGVTRQALVERAVRATIEACVTQIDADFMEDEDVAPQIVLRRIDPAPIVARVLGGGE